MTFVELRRQPCQQGPAVVWLDDDRSTDPAIAGAKASALAKASAHGLPVLPGFVVTTATTGTLDARALPQAVYDAWDQLSAGGRRPLVVRSSSTVEDGGTTSMAGVFTSVIDVVGWAAFTEAMATVLGSAKNVPGIEMAPMAVLVQPLLVPAFGGVLFGADPVTGRHDRLVVAAVQGGPDRLVSGEVDGAQYTLSTDGSVRAKQAPLPGLDKSNLRALASLAHHAAAVFGGPQDVEWAIDADGTVRLLQARPITTLLGGDHEGIGPVLGPGPVAETFPAPLSPLEEDLWIGPLRAGILRALELTNAASARKMRRSSVVVSISGRVAADLDLLGVRTRKRRLLAKLNPLPPARRLGAAWRVGRLRAAMPAIGADLLADIDQQLLDVGRLDDLTDAQLSGLFDRAQDALAVMHGNEVLAGLLNGKHATAMTGASAALSALVAGRAAGRSDDEILADAPVVLSLVPPRIGVPSPLPPTPARLPEPPPLALDDPLADLGLVREAFRLRVRWLHELMARAAFELGHRFVVRGIVMNAEDIRWLHRDELVGAIEGRLTDLRTTVTSRADGSGAAPLPAEFRLSADGHPVAVISASKGSARGAGGGRGTGVVHQGPGTPPAGAVLVVRTLDPDLAPVLPQLGGLIAETGSVLSHLAILAREFGVPTVVGVADALRRFPTGRNVLVDGGTGEVTLLEEGASS
jgi:rifampicin phosphotransferase